MGLTILLPGDGDGVYDALRLGSLGNVSITGSDCRHKLLLRHGFGGFGGVSISSPTGGGGGKVRIGVDFARETVSLSTDGDDGFAVQDGWQDFGLMMHSYSSLLSSISMVKMPLIICWISLQICLYTFSF